MPAPPRRLKDLIEGTVDHHASQACPDLQEVTIRWRGSYGYLIAWAGIEMKARAVLVNRPPPLLARRQPGSTQADRR